MYSTGQAANERGRQLVAAAAAAAAALAQAERQTAPGGPQEHYFPSASSDGDTAASNQGAPEGQPGDPQAEALHQYYTSHAHHAHHHHHYRLSSDSSLSSGSQFAGPSTGSAAHLHHDLHELQQQQQQHHHLHHAHLHQHARNLVGHHHHLQHGGPGKSPFQASMGRRLGSLASSFCSRKCLFVTCFLVIVFIFILVIALSAYLNFLINLNKTNLSPLSGRLRVEQPGDAYSDQLANRTSKEFLAKQQQYETILRGAFDRPESLLKSYPNHLVKSEVYSFKPASSQPANLWVYFRLFINKRTLGQDGQLMKRKSPDEHMDRQFLPRLTQQALLSGLEQLMRAASGEARLQTRAVARASQSNQVRSFDEQINRLMPIIESIDLQSIQVSGEFDMLQSPSLAAENLALLQQQSISDNLRASQLLTTTTTGATTTGQVMVATGAAPTGSPTSGLRASSSAGDSAAPRKFTLADYKENSTRPDHSAFLTSHQQRKAVQPSSPAPQVVKLVLGQPVESQRQLSHTSQQQPEGRHHQDKQSAGAANPHRSANITLFASLPNSARSDQFSAGRASTTPSTSTTTTTTTTPKATTTATTTSTGTPTTSTTATATAIVTATNQNNSFTQIDSLAQNNTSRQLPSATLQILAPYQKADFASTAGNNNNGNNGGNKPTSGQQQSQQSRRPIIIQQQQQQQLQLQPASQSTPPSSVQDLWANAFSLAKKNVTVVKAQQASSSPQPPISTSTSPPISRQQQRANQTSESDWQKISSDIAETIRAQLASLPATTSAPSTAKPKVAPHLHQGGSLILQSARQHEAPHSAVVLNRDLQPARREQGAESQPTTSSAAPVSVQTTTVRPRSRAQQVPRAKKVEPRPRIVDNFLASIGADQNQTTSAPMLATTIELTRSTNPPVRTAPPPTRAPSTSTTTTTTTLSTTTVGLAEPNGNQWRPITSVSSRKPSLTLIVSSGALEAHRAPPGARLQGSQSPFAMPALSEPRPNFRLRGPSGPRANTYQVAGGHEFESHRMSRMRQQLASQAPTAPKTGLEEASTPAHLVDDFIVTTSTASNEQPEAHLDREAPVSFAPVEGALEHISPTQPKQTRGPFAFDTLKAPFDTPVAAVTSRAERASEPTESKLLLRKRLFLGAGPPTSDASRSNDSQGESVASSNSSHRFGNRKVVSLQSASSPTPSFEDFDLALDSDRPAAGSGNRSRTPPSASSLISFEDSEQYSARCQYYGCKAKNSSRFTCLNHTQICDDFIDCQDESDELDCVSLLKHDGKLNRLSFSNGEGIIYLNRKGSLAPMCIDYFESDNGEQVELSRALSNAELTDRSPSSADKVDGQARDGNDDGQSFAFNAFASRNLATSSSRKQQELIRQINTIGQYACSLQSFSKLVSVKINHHNSVDGSNLIRASKHYHRLSIMDGDETSTTAGAPLDGDKSPDSSSFSSFKSSNLLSGQHEVEVSTTADCPSQRTVFVKCGGFECGQDSFSVSTGGADDQGGAKRKGEVIINDFPWLVKLYYMGSLACHGYLIDELWLISSGECFMNGSNSNNNYDGNINMRSSPEIDSGSQAAHDDPFSPMAWQAEISYEHYGNHDYQSIESNRRSIKDILSHPEPTAGSYYYELNQANPAKSSIVLAKLEKPVRFSPLNRPICLPLASSPVQRSPTSGGSGEQEHFDWLYRECVTATLPAAGYKPMPPTQELLLNKVRVQRTTDCLGGNKPAGLRLDQLICVVGPQTSSEGSPSSAGAQQVRPASDQSVSSSQAALTNRPDATHVLICSTIPSARSRSRWTIVGVQNRPTGLKVRSNRLLFTSVSSLTDWIIDTMNPQPQSNLRPRVAQASGLAGANDIGAPNLGLTVPNNSSTLGELEVLDATRNRSNSSSQACNQFKCSSGECLSWSRICDGLYDCSSHDDEKDCHK